MAERWKIHYFNQKVQEEVLKFPPGLLARYLRVTDLMQEFGCDLGMPHTRKLSGGLFEIRLKSKEGIGRVFYCTVIKRKIVVLHSFIKKSQKTPKSELQKAKRRMKEIRR